MHQGALREKQNSNPVSVVCLRARHPERKKARGQGGKVGTSDGLRAGSRKVLTHGREPSRSKSSRRGL